MSFGNLSNMQMASRGGMAKAVTPLNGSGRPKVDNGNGPASNTGSRLGLSQTPAGGGGGFNMGGMASVGMAGGGGYLGLRKF